MQNNQPQNPDVPKGQYPITADDKVKIQELGRKLQEFLKAQVGDKETFHIKIIVGAFEYVMGLQNRRAKLLMDNVADNFAILEKTVEKHGLSERVEEPFSPEPEMPAPTVKERREALQKMMTELDNEEAAAEVKDASPAPSDSATPPATPVAPANPSPVTPAPATPAQAAPSAPVPGAVPSPIDVTKKEGGEEAA